MRWSARENAHKQVFSLHCRIITHPSPPSLHESTSPPSNQIQLLAMQDPHLSACRWESWSALPSGMAPWFSYLSSLCTRGFWQPYNMRRRQAVLARPAARRDMKNWRYSWSERGVPSCCAFPPAMQPQPKSTGEKQNKQGVGGEEMLTMVHSKELEG